mmetsp:Transcript_30189/g.30672  ORF Transcript_30189/g.30672 Transcript_30189/m.30672 type:complete len:317 (+) Transcript_30189:95-1045(+)
MGNNNSIIKDWTVGLNSSTETQSSKIPDSISIIDGSYHGSSSSYSIGKSRPRLSPNKKNSSASSVNGDDPWGWFEDFEPNLPDIILDDKFPEQTLRKVRSLQDPVTQPPPYILESSLEIQQLWYETAGRRPQQPPDEREYYEKLWEKNFQESAVQYEKSNKYQKNKLKSPFSVHGEEGEVLSRGEGPFSNAVSKSFQNFGMRLQVPRFRIRRLPTGDIHAEYLVVVCLDNLTFGVWKRHSDFKMLITRLYVLDEKVEIHYKNAILSWKCVQHKQRWIRCLDKDYLMLKCFLLERFMHDLLFESSSPDLINEFLGLP